MTSSTTAIRSAFGSWVGRARSKHIYLKSGDVAFTDGTITHVGDDIKGRSIGKSVAAT